MFGFVQTRITTKTEAAQLTEAELTARDRAFLQRVAAGERARGLQVPFPSRRNMALAALAATGVAILILARTGAIPVPSASALTLYLPVADKSTNALALAGVGFVVGIMSGMTGVGGGFLMTPLLMTIGIPSTVAVGTDSAQIAGTASSGAMAHSRLGNVDVKLGLTILSGSLIGGTVGVQVVHFLSSIGSYDFWVRIIYIVVLGCVGSLMVREAVRTWARAARRKYISSLVDEGFDQLRTKLAAPEQSRPTGLTGLASRWPLQTEFKKAGIRASILFPFGMGLLIGFLAAIMGVGGGFIMVPSMIYILGVPTLIAVGTDLFQMVFTSSNVAIQQAITNHNVDILLGVLLLVGAAVGAQVGARLSTRLEAYQLRTFLGVVVVLVVIKMLLDITMAPGSLIGLSSGGGGH